MEGDKELLAMQEIIKSLEGLDKDARERVLKYVFNRLNINTISDSLSINQMSETYTAPASSTEPSEQNGSAGSLERVLDIRSLKEQKNPATAVEMAVLVAYYLEEFAPSSEKKFDVETTDISTYFKQAGYPLPKTPKMTLVHAKNAGYFESVERGRFKLNPVGYNLAAHTMGKGENRLVATRKYTKRLLTKKKVSKKSVKKK